MNIKQASGRTFRDTPRNHPRRPDNGHAFLLDPEDGSDSASDDLGEEIAESFLQSATSGQDAGQEIGDAQEFDELGGPFVETTSEQEMALGTDESNPEDAEAAPFPSPQRAL